MGLLSTLAGIAGAALGTALLPGLGTIFGASLGGTVGKVGGKIVGSIAEKAVSGKKPGQQYIQTPTAPTDTVTPEIRRANTALKTNQKDTKVAQAANPNGILEDPWQPMKTWYEDLGGDPNNIKIDDTRL